MRAMVIENDINYRAPTSQIPFLSDDKSGVSNAVVSSLTIATAVSTTLSGWGAASFDRDRQRADPYPIHPNS
ncbi:hypothetical protein KHC28_06850 [Ancylobacter sonchi]|uniref:hypothetical protein n=1 Tax=Ancylobacter sonchi TaxID=1937790 RepID=UPI001BD32529|nr:hypothetical protein [Ancylobacter sonchi]MBS7533371.1 hypothetical protein [Ancylobacter sonchi]